MTKEEFLIKDLEENESQSSWDWEADFRFAKQFYPNECKDIALIIRSQTLHAHQIVAHRLLAEKTKSSRLRTMRRLIKKGIVKAYWVGTGWGGKHDFGINRVRAYFLNNKPEAKAS